MLGRNDRINPNLEKYMLHFDDVHKKILTAQNVFIAEKELENLYKMMKEISPEFMKNNHPLKSYKVLCRKLVECEKSLPDAFIIDSDPNYKFGMMNDKLPDTNSIEDKLNWVVYMTRKYLDQRVYEGIDFNKMDLSNQCQLACKITAKFCDALNLNYGEYVIHPGFTERYKLFNGYGYHYFIMVSCDKKAYLIDCTYRQFFTLRCSNLERLGIVYLSGCRPGIFMTMDNKRRKIAEEILEKGWIGISSEKLKDYFDGFAISFRNGLFYEVTKDFSYTTMYSAKDYLNFLKGIDNQLNYENKELLGFQRTLKPTKVYK